MAADGAPARAMQAGPPGARPLHVIVLVPGFMGVPSNWDHIAGRIDEERRRRARRRRGGDDDGEEDLLVLVSKSNSFLRTRDGVDRCARRLVDELRTFAGLHHERIRAGGPASVSFVGHSFGGVLARYAAALLCEDEGGGRILGMRPRHYVSIASPHAGVGGGQLPFINIGGSKSIGDRLSSLVVGYAPAAAGPAHAPPSASMRRRSNPGR